MKSKTGKQYTIQTYKPEFKEAFKALNVAWISKYFVVEKKDLAQLDNPSECLDDGGEIFMVLNEDSAPVATCALYKTDDGVYELAKMAVDDSCKGEGLGSFMMEEIEVWAKKQNASEIFLLSNSSLQAAMGLYKKHGYVVFHQGDHEEYDRADIGMRKVLK